MAGRVGRRMCAYTYKRGDTYTRHACTTHKEISHEYILFLCRRNWLHARVLHSRSSRRRRSSGIIHTVNVYRCENCQCAPPCVVVSHCLRHRSRWRCWFIIVALYARGPILSSTTAAARRRRHFSDAIVNRTGVHGHSNLVSPFNLFPALPPVPLLYRHSRVVGVCHTCTTRA